MSYTKTIWQSGDVVTSEKLNKIETGIETASNSVLIVQITNGETSGTYVADKTAKEIYNAFNSGVACFACLFGQNILSAETIVGEVNSYYWIIFRGFSISGTSLQCNTVQIMQNGEEDANTVSY